MYDITTTESPLDVLLSLPNVSAETLAGAIILSAGAARPIDTTPAKRIDSPAMSLNADYRALADRLRAGHRIMSGGSCKCGAHHSACRVTTETDRIAARRDGRLS